ncbi:enoyl-CoA delta isomerase 2-like isoform X2 [Saccostrea echinata]|uniref:enoyl-CoA delta isomerase 2-like isoform X2 n=1 Tax=Saccostrea echinata TaxID=191078 RepID=UPI002A802355|nr:enoyl-CoA delta isomerase 2-like isoform X2 [Saccostrea echinata]
MMFDTKRVSIIQNRSIQLSVRAMGAYDDDFEKAKTRLNFLKDDPGNDVKLRIYALFKQATTGKCNTKKPGMMDFVGKAKWDAWNSLGDISQDTAKQKYIELVDELAGKEKSETPAENTTATSGKFTTLVTTNEGGVYTIKLNRPNKKNAINFEMYDEWVLALKEAAEDKNVVITVVTGTGDFYCSGNDLGNFMDIPPDGVQAMAEEGGIILERFVSAFIDFPKPLIGVINGPALGVSVTVLGLFDAVYATDKATFHTPFSNLGQSPEGCSSYTFPRMMGAAKASELLLFNKKITAQEAFDRNLVTEVFPDHDFQRSVQTRIQQYAKLPKMSLQKSKFLSREAEREILHQVNKRECEVLVERWQSEECFKAIMNFFSKSSSKL